MTAAAKTCRYLAVTPVAIAMTVHAGQGSHERVLPVPAEPVDLQRGVLRHAQRDVEYGAVLGDIDVAAGEHVVDTLA